MQEVSGSIPLGSTIPFLACELRLGKPALLRKASGGCLAEVPPERRRTVSNCPPYDLPALYIASLPSSRPLLLALAALLGFSCVVLGVIGSFLPLLSSTGFVLSHAS